MWSAVRNYFNKVLSPCPKLNKKRKIYVNYFC